MSFSRYIPWLITVASIGLLVFTWQDSRSQLQKKDLEIANITTQYNKLVSESNAKLKQLADEANQKIQVANQREVQVRVSFRKAFLSSGNVAGIANASNQTIAVTANVDRPSSGQTRSFSLTIDPGQTKEIGEREGWSFISGDVITIAQPEHKSLTFTAP